MRIKVKHRIAIAVGGSVALLGALGLYASDASYRGLRREVQEASAMHAQSLLDHLGQAISDHLAVWRGFASSSSVRAALRRANRSWEGMERDEIRLAIRREDAVWSSPSDATAREIEGADLSRALRDRAEEYRGGFGFPLFGEVFLTDRYGAVVAMSGRTSDYRQDDEDWWQAAAERGLYAGDVEFDESAGALSIPLAFRVEEEDGSTLGVMKVVLDLRGITSIVDDVSDRIAEHVRHTLALFDGDHRVIRITGGTSRPLEDGSRFFDGVSWQDGRAAVSTQRIDRLGHRRLATFVRAPDDPRLPGRNWIVLLEVDAREVMGPAMKMRAGILLAAALTMTCVLVLGATAMASTSRKIGSLAAAAQRFGSGALDARVPVEGRDELDALGLAFNQMADDLSRMTETLVAEKERAEQGETLKSDFLTMISHELRTPLNAILGSDELLLDICTAPEQRELAEMNRDAADSLRRVIDDILDFEELESRSIDLQEASLDVRAIVDQALRSGRDQACTRSIELSGDVAPGLPAGLRGDPRRVLQVLSKLVDNAVKFTERGSVRVHVRCDGPRHSRTRLRFEVSDTGIGIDRCDFDRIFRRFVQLDSSRSRSFEGTGLGLSIAKHMVERMGGEIGVESRRGEGSRFWFVIPCERVDAVPA